MPSSRLVHALRLVWVLVIVWYELLVFRYQVSQCDWPEVTLDEQMVADSVRNTAHVLLIADPQVLDHRSYPDRPPWLMWLSQRIVDSNMRKSWWATKKLQPDVIMFLGDMMDGGRFAMSDAEYEAYLSRTKDIFATDGSVPVYYIPGNHDVGIGVSDEWSEVARVRWLSHFGPLQQRVEISNHTFVLVDAPGLVEEERQRSIDSLPLPIWASTRPNGAIAFAHQSMEVARSQGQPTVLLTHIPLTRARGTSCGPLREQGTIRDGHGYGYENTLDYEVSRLLLDVLRPSIIFSGDDHDYCEIHHALSASDDVSLSKQRSVKEVSVKSFSIAMGVRRPGFQLLSLVPPSLASPSGPPLSDTPCFLPFQLGTYVFIYGPLTLLSLLILLTNHIYRAYHPGAANHSLAIPLSSRQSSLPNDIEQAAFMLPPPTPGFAVKAASRRKNGRPYSEMVFKLNLGGQKLVADLTSVRDLLQCACCATRGGMDKRRTTRVLRAFFADVLAVAWLPVALFATMVWWFL
ncbi:hypothetical protein BDW22DRAFT_1326613 [Trametopsis cervina]|nr:hypothetical protein BDW22DRAFT_1326613 [Trametopsis cervina]